MIFAKCRQYTLQIPGGGGGGLKFCRNHSVSDRLQDECTFALYAEIQEGCQKWWQSGDRSKFVFLHFWQKFENSKWPPFLKRVKFLRIANSSLLRYPVGRKFRRNRSISHG